MVNVNEIIEFLRDKSGVKEILPESDLNHEIGIYGDDWHEMIEEYSQKFNVKIDSYLWYFHTKEEGTASIGAAFFRPPNERVKRIPITPSILTDFANKGIWEIDYPEHQLPKRRYDLITNTVIVLSLLTILIITAIRKCT